MPPIPRTAAVYRLILNPRDPSPVVRGWNRLEGRPRSADLERSLRAEVRDPLWFLTRQWQFGEFEGDDTGSPIDARIAYETATLDGYGVAGRIVPYENELPLETRAYRETVPFDLLLHIQAAQTFERLLQAANMAGRLANYSNTLILDPATGIAGTPTPESRALFNAGRAFLFDTARLITMVRNGAHGALIDTFNPITAAEKQALLNAGNALVVWFERTYSQPNSDPPTWRPERLDHAFQCKAGQTTLSTAGGNGHSLDWYSFDAAIQSTPLPPIPTEAAALSFLPVSMHFAGVPSPRYWEMEDGKTDFSRLDVQANDVPKLLLAEFVLLFSNDWCLLPLELPVASFTRIQGLLVTDVFGDQTLVRPADLGRDSDWQRWSMFRLSGDDIPSPGLLLAPVLSATSVAPALEEIHFLRDEMANMVWAVEDRIPSAIGEALDPEIGELPPVYPLAANGGAVYRLGTWIPNNWRPFIPTHVPGSHRSIRLQRARMPDQTAQPFGAVLNVPPPYFVAEEEVPRAGRIITRGFRRTRWTDGTPYLWLIRNSTIGRGQGSSGLVFDQIDEQIESAQS
jgi:hypothetical protein